jgi:hypothetical protein
VAKTSALAKQEAVAKTSALAKQRAQIKTARQNQNGTVTSKRHCDIKTAL